jgi:hypothetical protein
MPGLSGLELQDHLVDKGISFPVIFITGHGTFPKSVKAFKAGALDFLQKPFEDRYLVDAVSRGIESGSASPRPAEGWIPSFRTDFGGFTVGSDFAWNVDATASYKLAGWLSLDVGFSALYADYEQGSFQHDVWTYGPWMGVGFNS